MTLTREIEHVIAQLWSDGFIPGEMHTSCGEEAIAAGVTATLKHGDAVASDHRTTAVAVMRGLDPYEIVAECAGLRSGLCGGRGGHMHLFSRNHAFLSSGIVGSSGPAAAGFAIAAKYSGTSNLAVAFFGDGAMNEGTLMESLNLARAWKLPVLFVCKDDDWAITTNSSDVSGGTIVERALAFGLETRTVDGSDAGAVFDAADCLVTHVRASAGPAFLHATCTHLDGHYLGDPLLRAARNLLVDGAGAVAPAVRGALRPGESARESRKAVRSLFDLTLKSRRTHAKAADPIAKIRNAYPEMRPVFDLNDRQAREKADDVRQRVVAAIEAANRGTDQ